MTSQNSVFARPVLYAVLTGLISKLTGLISKMTRQTSYDDSYDDTSHFSNLQTLFKTTFLLLMCIFVHANTTFFQ